MRIAAWLLLLVALAASASAVRAAEQLGQVDFHVSCSQAVGVDFNRGVALLHDFWYQEAERQFKAIVAADPSCALAHWGVAMSLYHEIWDRPDEATLARGRKETQKALALHPGSERERRYAEALAHFYAAGAQGYPARVDAYAKDMQALYRSDPTDPDAGAFYALAILAAEPPDDTSLTHERQALAVLEPLYAAHPDHPGLVHYIIHACDSPALASRGLAAARRYGRIAPSAAHAVHMPGHIFARLGLWPEDIEANTASVRAAQAAQAQNLSNGFDQLHADDFLVYAYLQRGDDAHARAVIEESQGVIARMQSAHSTAAHSMGDMFGRYRTKFPVFYALERRDWKAAAALEPVADASPESRTLTYWAHVIADGHLHDAGAAQADLATYDGLWQEIRKGPHAYYAEDLGVRISRQEMAAWAAYAAGAADEALGQMRSAADLQDRVGQGEVDIPAREMLADMLLELERPGAALKEYTRALELSPGRFNGLYQAARAAQASGDAAAARRYYQALIDSAVSGPAQRPELEQARRVLAAEPAA